MVVDCRLQVSVIGGTIEPREITINVHVEARLDKASEAAVVALSESVNITSDMVDASRLAWLTGTAVLNTRTVKLSGPCFSGP